MIHVFDIHGLHVEHLGLLCTHDNCGDMLRKECRRVPGPGVVVHAHLDSRIQRGNPVQQRLAVFAVECLCIPGIRRQRRFFHVVQIRVSAHKVGVNNAGREHIGHWAGEVQRRNTLVNLSKQRHDFAVNLAAYEGRAVVDSVQVIICVHADDAVGTYI